MNGLQTRIVETRAQAHEAAMQGYMAARVLIGQGKRVVFAVGEDSEPLSIKQRHFLHGPVLGQISAQVRVEGERYVMETWKEYFRKMLLPDTWVMRKGLIYDKKQCRLVPAKRATPHRVRHSTEDLTVRQYWEYTNKVIDYAVVEWGVVFVFKPNEREAAAYVAPKRVKKETVDVDTGEIMMEAAC